MLQITLSPEQLAELADQIAAKLRATTRREPYTVDEAAQALNVSPQSIRRQIDAGTIATVPNVGRKLIPAATVGRMLDGMA
jgi:excisionase family DNA binding protein